MEVAPRLSQVDAAWLRLTQTLPGADGACEIRVTDTVRIFPPQLDRTDRTRVRFSLVCGDWRGTGEVLLLERRSVDWRVIDGEQQ